jgi:1,4-alpha-glucan branching enzyme
MAETGYLMLVLHAHLPYVRHPEHPDFLEEDWFYEAITETYIPLLDAFERLTQDGVDFRLTMSLTPTLLSMFADPLLQERYLHHIERLIELAEKEVERTRWQPEFQGTAQMYRERFYHCRWLFADKYHRNLITAFRKFQDLGKLEIITCGATHGFMPLLLNPHAMRAQIAIGAQTHKKFLGQSPRGIWLAECGYLPGVDEYLREQGIRYFYLDSHGIFHGSPRPKYGIYAPVYTRSGVAAFGRDVESSKQVWSAIEGYPGDYEYRDFYRDVGFDLEYDYIKPYIHGDGFRIMTGIKYYKITGTTDDKQPYNYPRAREKAAEHAGNFMFNRQQQVKYLQSLMGGKKPLIVSPYDAELYGHWWYEGPEFLEFLFRKIHFDQKDVRVITGPEYLSENPKLQVVTPTASSWGYKGYNEQWLAGPNDWVYRHLHKAADRMVELADRYREPGSLERRALNQAAREVLLAQSSDWAFIMKTGTMVEYAVRRTRDHIERFTKLYYDLVQNRLDLDWLSDVEYKDNIFPDVDYRIYASRP